MIAHIFAVTLSGFAIAAFIMAFAPGESAARPGRWQKLVVYFLIVHVVLASAALGRVAMSVLVAAIVVTGGIELYRATRQVGPAGEPARYGIWAGYAMFAVGLVHSLYQLDGRQWIFLYVVVAGFDGFSQIIGQWLGRRPLAPVVSPRKTVEGAAGGFAAALSLALLLRGLIGADTMVALVMASMLASLALAGDLAASWVKRRAGIKDYGRLLPGQGGVLDRFDSFILAGAAAGPLFGSVGL